MRVLITDDSVFMRSAIGRVLGEQRDIEVVGKASDGREAVTLAKSLRPDVITLDIEMPEMDGLTALRRIMREAPTQVLMCSTLTTQGSMQSLQALRLGAADVIAKETSSDPAARQRFLDDLIRRVRGLGEHKKQVDAQPPEAEPTPRKPLRLELRDFDLLCIASSTGGPPVLETLAAALPADLNLPVVIAQHMPRMFTESMARRLDELCPLEVVHAQDRMPLKPGRVHVAPGGEHTRIDKLSLNHRQLRTGPEPVEALYMPSADVLYRSAAQLYGKRTLAIILTGIGHDGVEGAADLHRAGATILAQSRGSCVVYGMPRAVVEAGYATAVLNPDQIAQALQQLTPRSAAA